MGRDKPTLPELLKVVGEELRIKKTALGLLKAVGTLILAGIIFWPVSFVLLFVSFGYPLLVAALTLGLLVTFVFKRRSLPPVTFLGQLAFVVACPVYVVGLTMPLRLIPAFMKPSPALAAFDAAAAGAAVLVVVVVTIRDVLWRLRQIRQLEILPTARAGAAAVGLVELRGTARPATGEAKSGDVLFLNKPLPFDLEDDSGRIRVDPRGARIRGVWAHGVGGRTCEIVLPEGGFKCGDPVFVIGSAEPDPERPGLLVVRPRVEARTGFLWRTFLTFRDRAAEPLRDIQHVFFVSGKDEAAARRHLLNGLRQVLALAGVWLVSAAVLAALQLPKVLSYDAWSVAELAEHAHPREVELLARRYREGDRETRLEVVRRLRLWPQEAGREMLFMAALGDSDPETAGQAAAQLDYSWRDGRTGPRQWVGLAHAASVPDLLRGLESGAPAARSLSARLLAVLSPDAARRALPALLQDADPGVRGQAAYAIADAGARDALPDLVRALDLPGSDAKESMLRSATALLRDPQEFLHAFVPLLEHADPWVRQLSLRFLGHRGSASRPGLPEVLRRLDDAHLNVRWEAVGCITRIGSDAPEVEGALLRLFDDPDLSVRAAAVEALGDLRPLRMSAMAALVGMMDDPKLDTTAVRALAAYGSRAVEAMPKVARLLQDKEKVGYACDFIAALGPAVAAAFPYVEKALANPDPAVRSRAAETVGKLGGHGRAAARTVGALLEDPNEGVRGRAAEALRALKSDAFPALPQLVHALRPGSPSDGRDVAAILGQFGRAAAPAVPALVDHLRRNPAQDAAIVSLGEIGPAAVEAIPVLAGLLEGPLEWRVRHALLKIGPGEPSLAPMFLDRFRRAPMRQHRETYAILLCQYRAFAAEHVQEIFSVTDDGWSSDCTRALVGLGEPLALFLDGRLRDPDKASRERALRFLEEMGPGAAPALPTLEAMVRDPKHPQRNHAAMVIGAIGPAARSAVPTLVELLADKHAGYAGAQALAKLGPAAIEAVPALVKQGGWSRDADLRAILELPRQGSLAAAAAEALAGAGAGTPRARALAQAALASDAPEPRARALAVLETWSGHAQEVAVLLEPHLKGRHPELRRAAVQAMTHVDSGDGSARAFAAMLPAGDLHVRRDAFEGLRALGPAASAAVPELLPLLRSDVQEHRFAAVEILGRIGPPAAAAVPDLMTLLEKREPARSLAARALGRIGPSAAPALPLIESMARKEDGLERDVLTAAAEALRSPDPDRDARMREVLGFRRLDELRTALRDPSRSTRVAAAQRIEEMKADAAPALPELTAALSDPSIEVRALSARALTHLGKAAEAAVPALAKALSDAEPDVASAAAYALAATGPAARGATEEILAALHRHVRGAAPAVAAVGPPAAAAVPYLLREVDRRYPDTEAIDALGAIGPAAKAAVPALIRAAGHEYVYTRVAAARALGGIGPNAAEAVPALLAMLDGKQSYGGWDPAGAAASGLARIGEPAIPALVEALKPAGSARALGAATALGRMGPKAKVAVSALIEHTRSAGLYWKSPSIIALGRIGPDAKEALPLLRQIATGNSNVASEARAAIARIAR